MAGSSSDAVSIETVGLGLKTLLPSLPALLVADVLLVGLPTWAQQAYMGDLMRLTGWPTWSLPILGGMVLTLCKALFWGLVALQLAPRLGLNLFVRPAERQGGWFGWSACLLGAAFLQYLALVAGSLLLVIPGIILGCVLFLSLPVAALERVGPGEALSRSRALTKDNRMGIFGVQLLVTVPLFIANIAATTIIGSQTGTGFLAGMSSPIYLKWYAPVASLIYNPVIATAAVSIYVRLALKTSAGARSLAQVFD